MILRRAENLADTDNVRLDGVLWTVARVAVGDDTVVVTLRRSAGWVKELTLWPDDLVPIDL